MSDLFTPDELNLIPPPTFLIRPSLPEGLTVVFGDTNIGKTFLTIAEHLAIATGQSEWYSGHEIEAPERHTLYIAAEGNLGAINQRIYAWCSFYGVDPAETFKHMVLTARPVNLMAPGEIARLLEDFKDRFGHYPVLTTFDTLNMSMRGEGADENSNAQMGEAVSNIRGIIYPDGDVSKPPRTSVQLVHHTGHTEKLRYRGASALGAAADSMIGMSYFDPSINTRARWVMPDPHTLFEKGTTEPSFHRYIWNAKAKDTYGWEPKILKLEKVVYTREGVPERGAPPEKLMEESRVLAEDGTIPTVSAPGTGLSAGVEKVLGVLRSNGGVMGRGALAKAAGYRPSTLKNYLSDAGKVDLIEYDAETVTLIEPMVPEEASTDYGEAA